MIYRRRAKVDPYINILDSAFVSAHKSAYDSK